MDLVPNINRKFSDFRKSTNKFIVAVFRGEGRRQNCSTVGLKEIC